MGRLAGEASLNFTVLTIRTIQSLICYANYLTIFANQTGTEIIGTVKIICKLIRLNLNIKTTAMAVVFIIFVVFVVFSKTRPACPGLRSHWKEPQLAAT